MRSICTLLFVVSLVSSAYAQNSESVSRDTISNDLRIFYTVEQQAEFPGGIKGMMKFLSDSIVYPVEARKKKIQGKVFVKFIVEKDGSISNVAVLKQVDEQLGQEAIRVVSKFPKWIPGKQDGRVVRSQFVLPINFQLDKK